MSETNKFIELAGINVNEHVEKKGNLSYLSWAWALDQLMRLDANASWSYGEPHMYGETMMVFCTVIAFDKPRTMQLPVMDYKNKAILNPDAFAVNTAMQRCLVKAIALHGLGLYIYAGEDLPTGAAEEAPAYPQPSPELLKDANEAANSGLAGYSAFWKEITADERVAIGPKRHADFKLVAQEVKA